MAIRMSVALALAFTVCLVTTTALSDDVIREQLRFMELRELNELMQDTRKCKT